MNRWPAMVLVLSSACTSTSDESLDTDTDVVADTDVVDVPNRAPPLPTATIEPATPFPGTPLSVVIGEVTDPDGDTVIYRVFWTVEGPQPEDLKPRVRTIPAEQVLHEQTWTVQVWATDGEIEVGPVEATVAIGNHLPELSVVELSPEAPRASQTITASVEVTDADDDPVTLTYAWSVNGTVVAEGVDLAELGPESFDRLDNVRLTVTADDGHGGVATAQSARVTVLNSRPSQPVVQLLPGVPGDDDPLDCKIVVPSVDPDGDAVTYTLVWRRNRVTFRTVGNASARESLGPEFTEVGQLWTCEVVASDGVDTSGAAGAAVVVGNVPPDVAEMGLGLAVSCAVRADGVIACFGDDLDAGRAQSNGRAQPPDELFRQVAFGEDVGCGRRPDDTLVCWGRTAAQRNLDAPTGAFVDLDLGGTQGCAVGASQALSCWSHRNNVAALEPPAGAFTAVGVGDAFACALDVDGQLACWGANGAGQSDAPAGTFSALDAHASHACAVGSGGAVTCWGDNGSGQVDAPLGSFAEVGVGRDFSCGRYTSGQVVCWGDDTVGQLQVPDASYQRLWVGERHACGKEAGGGVQCWGDPTGGATRVAFGRFVEVDVGAGYVCTVDEYGLADCFGADVAGETRAGFGEFVRVDANTTHSCALDVDGEVACWGDDTNGQASPGPGPWRDMGVGTDHTCLVRDDGSLVCLGRRAPMPAIVTPPAGVFTAVRAGLQHSCGLLEDGTIDCWGVAIPLGGGQLAAPAGTYTHLSVGTLHACAIDTAQDVACWGRPAPIIPFAASRNQDGPFLDVSAGDFHSCGVRGDGTVDCWGADQYGLLEVPEGTFTKVSVGIDTACALDGDGRLWCWGGLRRTPLDR